MTRCDCGRLANPLGQLASMASGAWRCPGCGKRWRLRGLGLGALAILLAAWLLALQAMQLLRWPTLPRLAAALLAAVGAFWLFGRAEPLDRADDPPLDPEAE